MEQDVIHLARSNDERECWEMAQRGLEYLKRKSPRKSFAYVESTMELIEMPEESWQ